MKTGLPFDRETVEAEYTVRDGVIQDPGKFENEPVWAPQFWQLALEGEGDAEWSELGEPVKTKFLVDEHDVKRWPELAGVESFEMWEDDAGFVNTNVVMA